MTLTKEDRDKICSRVASLAALSLSPVEGEAVASRLKASELIKKYQLKFLEVSPHCQSHVSVVLQTFFAASTGKRASSSPFLVYNWRIHDKPFVPTPAAAVDKDDWRPDVLRLRIMDDIIYRYAVVEADIDDIIAKNATAIYAAMISERSRRKSVPVWVASMTLQEIDQRAQSIRQACETEKQGLHSLLLSSVNKHNYLVAEAHLSRILKLLSSPDDGRMKSLLSERLSRIEIYDTHCMALYKS